MKIQKIKNVYKKQTITQWAAGIGDAWANPDLIKMFKYSRENGVVPNLTTNGYGMTDEWVSDVATYCGGVAVSIYDPKDVCYDAVKRFVDAGIAQVNIHSLLSVETFSRCKEVVDDAATDPRLKGLKAIVFLTLKPKGKRNKYHILKDVAKYRELVDYAFSKGISVGFDSCSAPIFLAAMKDHPQFKQFEQLSESCESNRFSGYANVKGEYWHCSFTEGQLGWKGIDLTKVNDFHNEVWMSDEVKKFRNKLVCQNNDHVASECYLCPVYDLYNADIGNASGDNKIIPITEMR